MKLHQLTAELTISFSIVDAWVECDLKFEFGFSIQDISVCSTDLNCSGATNTKTYLGLFELSAHPTFLKFATSLSH